MLALESVAQRAAGAVGAALIILSGSGIMLSGAGAQVLNGTTDAEVLNSSTANQADRVAPSRAGGTLEFAFGDIELSMAPDWTASYDESVEPNCPSPHSLVLVTFTSPSPGNTPRPECGGGAATTTVVAWYPAAARLGRAPLKTINGIAVDGPVRRGRWSEYSLPAEHYVFYAEGPEATAIVRTVSYSARASLAHITSAFAAPKTWKHLTADGLRFAMPASWPVKHMSGQLGCEAGAPLWYLPGAAVIYRGRQHSLNDCPSFFGSLSGTASGLYPQFWGDGVVVSYPAQSPLGTSALWGIAPQSHVCSHAHGLTICPAAGDNTLYGPALFTVERPGSQQIVGLTVGLEGDGAVARTIIGSFAPS